MTSTIKNRADELGLSLREVWQLAGMSKATWHRRMASGQFRQLELNALAHVLGYRTTAELTGEGAAA